IQFAGFTFGKTQSYFDFLQGTFCYGCGFLGGGPQTGAAGTLLAAYTGQFGNGFSATVAIEDNTARRNAIWDATDKINGLAIGAFPGPGGFSFIASTGACNAQLVNADVNVATPAGAQAPTAVFACPTGDYAAQQFPDIVGNLRVDQAWGSAQIAGALHQLGAGPYGSNVAATAQVAGVGFTGTNPPDRWGWAVLAGIVVNLPWAQGYKFWVEGAYAQGAPAYTGLSQNGVNGFFNRFNGN